VVVDLVTSNWYNSEQMMHRPFLFPEWNGKYERPDQVRDVMSEAKELSEYLKGLWRTLVVYNVVWREMGVEVEWESLIANALWSRFMVPLVWNAEKGDMWFS